MSGARRDPTAAANSAVTLMKQAVEAAIEHGDIKIEVVCKAVGMSRSQMQTWLASRAPSAQWDTKLAEWLKKVQTRAIEGATSSGSRGGGGGSSSSKGPIPAGLGKAKEDILELEDYIPWNVVVPTWGGRRMQWAKRTKECRDVASVAKQLIDLEKALQPHAFEAGWKESGRNDWVAELQRETSPYQLRQLVREMEEQMRWKAFAQTVEVDRAFKALLASPGGTLLKEAGLHRSLQAKLDHFNYASIDDLAADCRAAAEGHPRRDEVNAAIAAAMGAGSGKGGGSSGGGGSGGSGSGARGKAPASEPKKRGGGGGGAKRPRAVVQPESDDDDDDSAEEAIKNDLKELGDNADENDIEMREGLVVAAAKGLKRSRISDKEKQYDRFKEEQRLHPEYAGVYAEAFLEKMQELHTWRELFVFEGSASRGMVSGVLQIQPHTTFRDLRRMLAADLQIGTVDPQGAAAEADLNLFRAVLDDDNPTADASAGASAELSPLLPTQNHKLVYPFFPLPAHVLVVRRPRKPPKDALLLKALARRAQSNERLLSVDNSRGHERLAIPVFNGVDAENDHNTFTYVPHCVVNEGLRLLMGGPLREPAPCPFIAHGDAPGRPEGLPYDEHRRFVHPPHTVESVYECSLTSGCSMECENRLVQRGPTFRLEVFRCGGGVQKYVKGWGVRSPDFIPRGSFVCEYIGEYISDDEAESRGIRYDDKMMSRLMDVYGDGKDVVRMCIDATNFSNLGRFLNHCCDPNCFKQRVFCDHDSRLPRIAFFALRDIEPNVELVYDYGYADVPGKTMPCLCGAKNCKKLLY